MFELCTCVCERVLTLVVCQRGAAVHAEGGGHGRGGARRAAPAPAAAPHALAQEPQRGGGQATCTYILLINYQH